MDTGLLNTLVVALLPLITAATGYLIYLQHRNADQVQQSHAVLSQKLDALAAPKAAQPQMSAGIHNP